MATFRGFIAVDIGAFPKLLAFENDIKKTGANVKLVEPDKVHITLKFLGDTNEDLVDDIEGILTQAVHDVDPFDIQLKGAGVFPNEKYIKVIWIGIEHGGEMKLIADTLDNHLVPLGFAKEKRGFSPHLTIARVKTAKNKEHLLQLIEKYRTIEFTTVRVDVVRIKKSELTPRGPIYTTLREVHL